MYALSTRPSGDVQGDLLGADGLREPDAIQSIRVELAALKALLERLLEGAELNLEADSASRLLTTEDVAYRWQCSPRTVEDRFASAELVATYIGGARRFSLAAVKAYERHNTRSKPKRKKAPMRQAA